MEKTEKELLKELNEKMDKLIGVTAIQGKSENAQIKVLMSLGFKYKEISAITGVAEGTLKSRKHNSKKKGK